MKIKHKVAKVTTDIFDHLFINVAPNPQKIPDRKPYKSPMFRGCTELLVPDRSRNIPKNAIIIEIILVKVRFSDNQIIPNIVDQIGVK